MKKTYKYQLPQNKEVKSTAVRVENGEILVDVEFKEKFEPQDGDFLCTKRGKVFIYNGKEGLVCGVTAFSAYIGVDPNGKICSAPTDLYWVVKDDSCYATEQEKADFLERLEKELHKRWNAETKQLEDIRWKPEEGEHYWFINDGYSVSDANFNGYNACDIINVNMYNCFKTKEAAKDYADKIKGILKNSKPE